MGLKTLTLILLERETTCVSRIQHLLQFTSQRAKTLTLKMSCTTSKWSFILG